LVVVKARTIMNRPLIVSSLRIILSPISIQSEYTKPPTREGGGFVPLDEVFKD
jgi:hypothetical protein